MAMRYEYKGDDLVLYISGNIDSTNCTSVENQIDETLGALSFLTLILDFKDVDYVSSAGLRIMLKLKKRYIRMRIENVNPDVYDVFDMTCITSMIDIQKAN